MLKKVTPYTLFMPSSTGWIKAAKGMYGERLVGFSRYSFSSEHISAEHLDHLSRISAFKDEVTRMDQEFATKLWGQDHFVNLSDFDSPEDFVQRGIEFYLQKNSTVVGAVCSSLVCSKGIEVSLFVLEDYRRQGIATILASHLLEWCIANNVDTNWDAANPESCKLAEKLGYIQRGEYQAHYLET
jgi:GNAT superfamily N-acetyltransferase